MMDEHYRHLEALYRQARINRDLFPTSTIQVSEKRADIGMEIRPEHHHGMDAAHGSVLFKLLDDAAFFAVNSVVTDVFVVTTSFHLHFVRPVTEGKVRAVGAVKYRTRDHMVAEASVYNEQGKEIGFGTGSFKRSKFPIGKEGSENGG